MIKLKVIKEISTQIKWLEIETDELDTKGAFLYQCNENGCYDTWHKTLEDAFLAAEELFGIKKTDWTIISIV